MQAPSFVRRGVSERLKAFLIEKYGATTNDDATTERDHGTRPPSQDRDLGITYDNHRAHLERKFSVPTWIRLARIQGRR